MIGLALSAVLAVAVASGTQAKSAPRKMAVAGGDLIIAAPKGFCVEVEASQETPAGAFVLFGSCASLARSSLAAQPEMPAILTAVVSPGAPERADFRTSIKMMASFLTSPEGRKALSRAGKAKTVTIKQIVASGDVLYIRLSDVAALGGQDVEPEYWRALFVLNGQFVTLSVLGLADRPLASDRKRGLLGAFVDQVEAEN